MKMIIDNKVFNLDIADTFYKKFRGLMWKKDIKKGMLFPKTSAIHTFFMKSNIDVIMLNKECKIIYYQKNVRKNKIIIKKSAYYTIELPCNLINDVQLYQTVTLENQEKG